MPRCHCGRPPMHPALAELLGNALLMAAHQASKSCAGGEIASTFDKPEAVKLGSCKLIEEIMIGEDKLIHFSGVEMGEACTIILRGASKRPATRNCTHALCSLWLVALAHVSLAAARTCGSPDSGPSQCMLLKGSSLPCAVR